MAIAVYVLCALTSLACAVLLLRAYRAEPVSLVLGTALCFCGLALNNLVMFFDVMFALELTVWRKLPALGGILLLLYGFVSDSR